MTGYFSHLIKQTGITFQRAGQARSGEMAPVIPASSPNQLRAPLEVNEERFIDSHRNREVEPAVGKRGEGLSSVPSKTAGEGAHDLTEKDIEIALAPQKHSGEFEPAIRVEEVSSSSNAERFHQSPDSGRHLEALTVSAIMKPQEQPSYSIQPRVSAGAPERVGDRAGEARSPEIRLAELHDWLAGGREEHVEIEVQPENTVPRPEAQTTVTKVREMIPASARTTVEPESHEFLLSIGSINVTVEQPHKSLNVSSQPPRVERRPKSTRSTSRLNRHYLRTR
jgi:hypothetical protein